MKSARRGTMKQSLWSLAPQSLALSTFPHLSTAISNPSTLAELPQTLPLPPLPFRHTSHQYHSKRFTLPLFSHSYALAPSKNISSTFSILSALVAQNPRGGGLQHLVTPPLFSSHHHPLSAILCPLQYPRPPFVYNTGRPDLEHRHDDRAGPSNL